MKYLIDTHILLWCMSDCELEKLSPHALQILRTEKEVFVSIVSLWEIALKNSTGQLAIGGTVYDIEDYCADKNISILPISVGHIEKFRTLPYIHNDPFDRLMTAQAIYENMIFITKDSNIAKYDVITLWK